MLTFHKKHEYGPQPIDPEVEDLCNAMNALPGIKTTNSCCGHGKSPAHIFFQVRDPIGLFFLTRCVDRRYWQHGWRWTIHLSVGDVMKGGYLPTGYVLESVSLWGGMVALEDGNHFQPQRGLETVGEDAYSQMQDLVENMNEHLNHEEFMNLYNLDAGDFDV